MMLNVEVDENYFSNSKETLLIIYVDNGRRIGFVGDVEVKFSDAPAVKV